MTLLAAVIVLVTLIVMTTGRQPAVLALICALVVAGLAGIATPAQLFGQDTVIVGIVPRPALEASPAK